MGRLKLLTLVGAAVASVAAPAFAADLLPPPPPLIGQAEGVAVTELGSGWYLRGDVGSVTYSKPGDKPYGVGGAPFDTERLKTTFSLGGGFGYKFTNWFRADVTADQRWDADFDATSSRTRYTQGYSRDAGKLESTTVLLNGYIDLGNWYGITPYAGAGVGVAENRFHKYWAQVTCLTNQCGDPTPGAFYPLGPQGKTFTPGGTQHHLAWALMAGGAIDLPMGFKLDVGYRYLNIGDARTKLDPFGIGTRTKDLQAHEIRVGMRYMID